MSRAFLALATTLLLAPLPAGATCGSASCFLVTGTSDGLPSEHAFQVDVSIRIVDQDRKLSGTESVDEVLTPKIDFENRTIELGHHREIRTVGSVAQLDLAYGLTPKLALHATLPVWVDKEHEHVDDVGGPDEHFTNDAGTRGFGDVLLGARYGWTLRPTMLLIGGLALELPTGPYKLRDEEGAIAEPTIQPGSGSWDVLATVSFSQRPHGGSLEWFASAGLRSNGESDLDYEIGDETVLNVGTRWAAGDKLELSFQLDARDGGRDRYLGMGVPSTGATTVFATPGIRFRGETSFYAFVQLPVHEKVNEAQLAPRTGYVLGLSRTF